MDLEEDKTRRNKRRMKPNDGESLATNFEEQNLTTCIERMRRKEQFIHWKCARKEKPDGIQERKKEAG